MAILQLTIFKRETGVFRIASCKEIRDGLRSKVTTKNIEIKIKWKTTLHNGTFEEKSTCENEFTHIVVQLF